MQESEIYLKKLKLKLNDMGLQRRYGLLMDIKKIVAVICMVKMLTLDLYAAGPGGNFHNNDNDGDYYPGEVVPQADRALVAEVVPLQPRKSTSVVSIDPNKCASVSQDTISKNSYDADAIFDPTFQTAAFIDYLRNLMLGLDLVKSLAKSDLASNPDLPQNQCFLANQEVRNSFLCNSELKVNEIKDLAENEVDLCKEFESPSEKKKIMAILATINQRFCSNLDCFCIMKGIPISDEPCLKSLRKNKFDCVTSHENIDVVYRKYLMHCPALYEIKTEILTNHKNIKDNQRILKNKTRVGQSVNPFNINSDPAQAMQVSPPLQCRVNSESDYSQYAVDVSHCIKLIQYNDILQAIFMSDNILGNFSSVAKPQDPAEIKKSINDLATAAENKNSDLNVFAYDTLIDKTKTEKEKLDYRIYSLTLFQAPLGVLMGTWPTREGGYQRFCDNHSDSCENLQQHPFALSVVTPNADMYQQGLILMQRLNSEIKKAQIEREKFKELMSMTEEQRKKYLDSLGKTDPTEPEPPPPTEKRQVDCVAQAYLAACQKGNGDKNNHSKNDYLHNALNPDFTPPDHTHETDTSPGAPKTDAGTGNDFVDHPNLAGNGSAAGPGGGSSGTGTGGGGGGGGGSGGGAPSPEDPVKKDPVAVSGIENVEEYGRNGGRRASSFRGNDNSSKNNNSEKTQNPFDRLFGNGNNYGGIKFRDLASSNSEIDEQNGFSNIFTRISNVYQRRYHKGELGGK